jgi:hypothetical protein
MVENGAKARASRSEEAVIPGFGAILPLAEKKRKEEKKERKKTEKTGYKKHTPPRHCPGFSPILPIAVGFNRRTGEGKKKKPGNGRKQTGNINTFNYIQT